MICYITQFSLWYIIQGDLIMNNKSEADLLKWVRGLMAINVRCEFHGQGSIRSMCQITDADFGQVG